MDHEGRLAKLREEASMRPDDAMFVSAMANIRYFSGFSGSAGLLLVLPDSAVLIVDGRYEELAAAETAAGGVEVVSVTSDEQYDTIVASLRGISKLLIDPQQVTMDVYTELEERLPRVTLALVRGVPERLRLVKDDSEIARIRRAAQLALLAFYDSIALITTDVSEKELATKLEARIKATGADDIAFSTIVASGPNSSKPHGGPTSRRIREGEPVVMDFGAMVDGYHSDITRTVWFGELHAPVRPIYHAAWDAHEQGVASARPGLTHAEVDRAARSAFRRHGFVGKPLHPSGHSVGLSIHERPFMTPYASDCLQVGYVVTVEPGLYVPGVAGCRIEDTLLVREGEPMILSSIDDSSRRPKIEGVGGLDGAG